MASTSPPIEGPPAATTAAATEAPKPVYRPRRNADPLRRPTKPERRPRPPPGTTTTTTVQTLPLKPRFGGPSAAAGAAGQNAQGAQQQPAEPVKDTTTWTKFPLKTTKRELMKDLRYHIMKLQSKNKVDITEPDQFTLPIRLHRRDPRAPPQGAKEEQMALAAEEEGKKLDPEEQKKLEEAQAAKEADQAATLAAIAPYGGAQRQKKNAFKKKTQQVYQSDEKAKKLRYEEYFPWHIEDFDNKNTWVGNLEGALSDGSQAIFIMDGNCFRMIPVEKWYKFTQRSNFKTLSIEEAEAAMKKKSKTPRWLMDVTKVEEKAAKAKEEAENKAAARGMYLVKGDRLANRPREEVADADELDFDENFQDDEEAPIMEGEEEENRQIEKRIKKEQLTANFFGIKSEKEYEEEEREKRKKERLERKGGKKVIKYLRGHEKNLTYESDSDENPYASSSEDSSSEEARQEEERKKAEEKKREEERKQLEAEKKKREEEEAAKKAAAAAAAAASTPTPTISGGAAGKLDEANKIPRSPKKAEKHKQLKRTAGDPYASESGTDTGNAARKKARSSAAPTPSTTNPPTPSLPSASLPGGLIPLNSKKRAHPGGTASDTEGLPGADLSSNETLAKKQKFKLKMQHNNNTSLPGTPSASASGLAPPPVGPDGRAQGRASSPPGVGAGGGGGGGSNVGTPSPGIAAAGASRAASPGSGGTPAPPGGPSIDITPDEVRAVLTMKPEGQELKEFLSHFKGRVGKENMNAFLAILRPLSRQKGKLICPR